MRLFFVAMLCCSISAPPALPQYTPAGAVFPVGGGGGGHTFTFVQNTNVRQGVGNDFTSNGQNMTVSNSYFFAVEIPTVLATVTPSAVWSNEYVFNNRFAGGVDQWDDPVDNSFHHDGGFHNFAQATDAHINGFYFYNNLTYGIWGNDSAYFMATGGTHITAYAYPEQTGGDVNIFNNVFDLTAGTVQLQSPDNGIVFCKSTSSPGMQCVVYNNTIIGATGNTTYNVAFETDTGTGNIVKNNIYQAQGLAYYYSGGPDNANTVNNNVYWQIGTSGWNTDSFATWQGAGNDANGVNGSDPNLNTSTYRISSGSSAIGLGADLFSLCDGQANPGIGALCSDAAGIARPDSAWDAGAFQLSSDTAPTVTTTSASAITSTSATASGNVTSDGGQSVTSRGTCYATSSNPTTPCTSNGTGTGSFSSSLTGLNPSTLYHIRAFATNSVGTSYGSDLTFTTSASAAGAVCSGPCVVFR